MKSKAYRLIHRRDRAGRQARRRARQRGAVIKETVKPLKIAERDQWTCGICKQPILPDAKSPDPLSLSIDHIIPLSRGGEHSTENCQASHLICNTRKGSQCPI